MKKPFIIAVDDPATIEEAEKKISSVLHEPGNMINYVGYIKFNDAFHLLDQDIRSTIVKIRHLYDHKFKIFFDFKLPDTNGTDINIVKKYITFMEAGDIVTASSNTSWKAFKALREKLPKGVKIALVSVLTDTDRVESQMRRGMVPEMAILNDAINLLETGNDFFDMVVCSPSELEFLKRNLPSKTEFVAVAIRDAWMNAGQQSLDRIKGVTWAMDAGADYLVMGSQLLKGNPGEGIDAVASRQLSIDAALSSPMINLVKGDPLQTLKNLKGFYKSPVDDDGNFKGPLVAYAGTYESEEGLKHYVGDTYFNLAKIEKHPKILNYFAEILAEKIRSFEEDNDIKVTALVGVPTGGEKIAQEVGRLLNIPGIRLEKKVLVTKTEVEKEKFELHFRRDAGVISNKDLVILCEDLCNNFSTTNKALEAVNRTGAVLAGVSCVANRSNFFQEAWKGLPILSVISVPSDQYQQSDVKVVDLIKAGKISTDPKKDWSQLKKTMEEG